jgi:hypothetical protein
MLIYQLSQKLKLIERGKFNHLTITLEVQHVKYLIKCGKLTESRFDSKTLALIPC